MTKEYLQGYQRVKNNAWRICVIAGFLPASVEKIYVHTIDFIQLLEPLAKDIFIISRNFPPQSEPSSEKIHIVNIRHRIGVQYPMLVRIPGFIIMQLKISYNLIKLAKKVDIIFMSIGVATLVLPVLTARLLGKKVISIYPGPGAVRRNSEADYQKTLFGIGKHIFLPIVGILERLNYCFASKIVVYLPELTDSTLKRHTNKIFFSGSRFYVDIDFFKVKKNLDDRESLVGYVGEFIEVKGVMNFGKAIPLILKESIATKIMMVGDGSLRADIEKEIKDAELGNKVIIKEWVPHDKLPGYLNKLKLLVIPSYIEVGPLILFEAMACGTPVLSVPVGVVPGVIKDGETGFIMEDNSPECIARNVIRALSHPNLEQIAKKARAFAEKEYSFEAAVKEYKATLAHLK